MASNMTDDQIRDSIRKRLNTDKIKLWLPPYTRENGEKGDNPADMIAKYSTDLGIPTDIVAATLEQLRQHALEKLAARERFQKEGIANLKIKLTGSITPGTSRAGFDFETKLDIKSSELKQKVSDQIAVGVDHLKLISCGCVLDDSTTLKDHGLGQFSQVMVICLSESEVEARKRGEQRKRLERTKEAAKILAQRNTEDRPGQEDDQYFLQIADHTGRPIKLPDEERQALSVALTLNEKGRACLKRKQYGEALLILLEADQAFRQCRSEILQAVDNYAVLCLDIVWCYLCLQNVDQLPDAESRLRNCEECFSRSYGPNMERLTALKGDSGRELALYVRLYLLQGIVAVLKKNFIQARTLLQKSEQILNSLQVDESKLMQLVSMGYEISEARLGLRSSGGNVSHAITKIQERKDRKKEIAEKEKEEREQKKLQRKIGKTADGSWVKIEIYNQLLGMGFPAATVGAALKQTNSDLHAALRVIQEQPNLLSLPDSEADPNWDGPITDQMLAQVTEFGFGIEVAREALRRYRGLVEKAVENLLATGGVLPALPTGAIAALASTSTQRDDNMEPLTDEQKQAIEEVLPDIPDHEEDYLDLTLDEEASFIAEYKARIESASHT